MTAKALVFIFFWAIIDIFCVAKKSL
jgi:hypothetical protein